MAGDILLGTEENGPFHSIDDLAKAMDGQGLCCCVSNFLRGTTQSPGVFTVPLECRTTERTESRVIRVFRRSFGRLISRGPADMLADSASTS